MSSPLWRYGGRCQVGSDHAADKPLVAVVGGGQLARMMAEEVVTADVGLVVVGPATDDPVPGLLEVAPGLCQWQPIDEYGLDALLGATDGADVVTFDHEVIAPDVLAGMESAGRRLAPRAEQMLYSDKAVQRERFAAATLPVPTFAVCRSDEDVQAWAEHVPGPWVIKAARGGYDGRGVLMTASVDEAKAFRRGCTPPVVVAEERLDLTAEAAVLIARRRGGQAVTWPPVETVQRDGMCAQVLYPASLPERVLVKMTALAETVAEEVQSEGVLAIEFFVVGDRVLINELAPRPHNSGHLTIEGSDTSQFVNHLRGAADTQLGPTDMRWPYVVMANIVGSWRHRSDDEASADDAPDLRITARQARFGDVIALDAAAVHLYGKGVRPGRKVGHVTAWGTDADVVRARAERLADSAIAQLEARRTTESGTHR